MLLTPGVDFIIRTLFDFFLPCGVIYMTLLLGSNHNDLMLPTWVLVTISLGLRLGYIVSQSWVKEYQNSKTARVHGAILAHHAEEKHLGLAKSLAYDLDHGYPCGTFDKMGDKYGTIYRFSLGREQCHFTTEPSHIKAILATEFEVFDKGPMLISAMKSLLGDGVFNSDASFFLVRVLQKFNSFSLEEKARPIDASPKPEWAGLKGPQGRDKIRLKNNLTMYVKGGLWIRMKDTSST